MNSTDKVVVSNYFEGINYIVNVIDREFRIEDFIAVSEVIRKEYAS